MSVPASSERFLAKARDLPVDEVMLDLEDSVAPDAKPAARELAVAALRAGGWDGKLVAVRVNGVTTPWAYQDVIAVTEGCARRRRHADPAQGERPGRRRLARRAARPA